MSTNASNQILRNLVIVHLSADILSHEPERFVGLGTDLKSIPIWPVFHASSPDQLVSANDSWMAGDSRLLVPWMKDCSRFVLPSFSSDARNHDCLLKLGVKKLPIQTLLRDYILPMPSTLSTIQWKYFQPLISAIAGIAVHSDSWNSLLPILTDSKVAADGNCKLTKTCEMYDHEDPIFTSAFRHQKETRFLHKSVEGYRLFWLRLGLRHRANNSLSAGDYIQCLKVLKARLNAGDAQNDPHLEQDSRTVLSLLTSPLSNIQSFAGRWDAIARESMFRSRTNFSTEPQYRRDTMVTLATDKEFLHLSDVILFEHVAICWTQTPFVVHQPTREVLGKLTSQGQAGHPDIDMVWQHLQSMKILSEDLERDQIHDFLTDLDLTYEYLQDHLESRDWYNVGNEAIWLNLGTSDRGTVQLEDIASSWQGIENLVLSSSCDAGKMKAVRPRLMRFEKLLRGMGCRSITYPTVTRPTLHLGCSVSKSLRQLRKDEKLLDITFSTEGRLVKAHKVVLGAASEKCAQQFDSRWRQEDIITYDENTDPDDYMSYHTLSTMIDHAYEEEINWKEMEVLDDDDEDEKAAKLDLLLDLHKGADCWIIPALMSQVEDKILVAGKAFVNLSNVVEIRERAEMVGAKVFEGWCAEMIEDNQHIVDKAQEGS
jgi:sacsin